MFLSNEFNDKKVLVTGHTGFKGSWLCLWLFQLGAKVYGISDQEYEYPNNFNVLNIKNILVDDLRCDITMGDQLKNHIIDISPDFIFHLAAQPIVKTAYQDPLKTFTTNALGSINLLEAIKSLEEVVCVMITSDKVYENKEWIWGYRENDELGGLDPYSASKSMAEIGIRSFYHSFLSHNPRLKLAVARAGNVIGGGDWAANRIVPDTMRSWSAGRPVIIRNPNSTRPWQHVLEPLGGYLLLAKYISDVSYNTLEAFNFGPSPSQNATVEELVNLMGKFWGEGMHLDLNSDEKKEAGLLRLNCDKAQTVLGWRAILDLDDCAEITSQWYSSFYSGNVDMKELTISQLKRYSEKLESLYNI